jgi:hypothetical protein
MKLTLKFAFCLYLLLTSILSFAQDVIIFKNGDEIQSKVLEVSTDIVKYKKWANQDGPIYSSTKVEVFMIKYQNGTKDVFKDIQPQVNVIPVDNSSKVIGIAKPFMDKQISTESKGACKMVEFYKQNGVEKDIFGQKIYTLEYRLIIELQRDFWKESADKGLNANWYWGDFNALEKKGDVYAEAFTNNYQHFSKGTKIEITGVIDFENTDNGWRMTGVNMFSYGYKNKTSKVLPNIVNVIPVKPEQDEAIKPIEVVKGTYVGDYKDEKKDGFGKMNYEDGSSYEGEWKNDKKEGKGTYIYGSGYGKYVGSFKDDKKSGLGKMTYYNGSSYEGEWEDDEREGEGTYISAKGTKYVGNSVAGKKNGKGTFYNSRGDKEYEGDYESDKRHGYGTVTTTADDGTKVSYIGNFREGKIDGQGTTTLLFQDGTSVVFTGEHKENQFFNGTLTKIEPNGTKYISVYKNGKKKKEKKQK